MHDNNICVKKIRTVRLLGISQAQGSQSFLCVMSPQCGPVNMESLQAYGLLNTELLPTSSHQNTDRAPRLIPLLGVISKRGLEATAGYGPAQVTSVDMKQGEERGWGRTSSSLDLLSYGIVPCN